MLKLLDDESLPFFSSSFLIQGIQLQLHLAGYQQQMLDRLPLLDLLFPPALALDTCIFLKFLDRVGQINKSLGQPSTLV